jgi:GntR family transcriptional regulator/MocR family aminotransferase
MRSLILADWLLQYLEKGSGEPITRQIYRLVQTAILAGRLATGAKLPSSRALAKELGVARNTIVEVYDQLLAEGYVESSAGSGTYIADTTPDHIEGAIPRGDADLVKEERKPLSIRGELLIRMAGVGQYQWGAFMPGLRL